MVWGPFPVGVKIGYPKNLYYEVHYCKKVMNEWISLCKLNLLIFYVFMSKMRSRGKEEQAATPQEASHTPSQLPKESKSGNVPIDNSDV